MAGPGHRPDSDGGSTIGQLPAARVATVIERGGTLYGRVALTVDAPAPKGIVPVGIDLNETNALDGYYNSRGRARS